MKKVSPETRSAWENPHYDTASAQGRFIRQDSLRRNWITRDGAPGPTGAGGFKAEAGRYHLFISMACPWAHRTLLMRKLKNLDGMISVANSLPFMGPKSWSYAPQQGRIFSGEGDDDEYIEHLYELYRLDDPDYAGRATVPVLWDKQGQTIVSNESAEIIRMFNREFDHLGAAERDFYPDPLRQEIDALNDLIYDAVNNGVYKAGFATTQEAYEEAVWPLFETLDALEARLGDQRFLCGAKLTEADIRLFPTLARFDSVYAGHFKCGLRRIADYPNLWGYTRDIWQLPGLADTIDIEYNKVHYYGSHHSINPTGIVPIGPDLDFMVPHGRERLGQGRSPFD